MIREEQIKRAVIRVLLVQRFGEDVPTLPSQQIEKFIQQCEDCVTIDMDQIEQKFGKIRSVSIVQELIVAGCHNRLLRIVFGISLRKLSQLRSQAGISNPWRARPLRKFEARKLDEDFSSRPIHDWSDQYQVALWCLSAHKRHGLPFVSIYRHITDQFGSSS